MLLSLTYFILVFSIIFVLQLQIVQAFKKTFMVVEFSSHVRKNLTKTKLIRLLFNF